MKLSTTVIKTLVVSMILAFAGHALAAPTDWFSGTANGSDLDLVNATTNHLSEGVEIAYDVLSIDLPTGQVFQITPSNSTAGENNGKTFVDVSAAEFTPTAVGDIDNSVVVDAQTALTVAYDANNATNYYAYITNNWVKLSGAVPVATPVAVTIELDYSDAAQTNVAFKVGGATLRDEFDNEAFPISGERRALGHVELAGYGKIHSVTTTVEDVANVTVTPGDVAYGADFTNVTITAKLSGTGYSDPSLYTLTWNGNPVSSAVASVSGDTLTITAPIDPPASGRAPVTYAINVKGAAGETQNTVVADTRAWVTENKDSQHTTGTWDVNVGDITYEGTVATVSDNTYTANSCTTGDLVTITFENLEYTELSDLSVTPPTGGVQGAFALAENGGATATNFYVLAWENNDYAWKATTCDTSAAVGGMYTVVMTFDYVSTNYAVTVNGNALKINNNDKFPLCVVKSEVTDFVFKGSGTMTGIKGVDSLGYMAKDGAGHWYATIDAATKSGGSEFTVLRDTDPAAPAGWKFDTVDGIKKLVKAAKGVFFMVY